jgi:hypothetical protein
MRSALTPVLTNHFADLLTRKVSLSIRRHNGLYCEAVTAILIAKTAILTTKVKERSTYLTK